MVERKTYLVKYSAPSERVEARKRFQEKYGKFQTGQFWASGVSIYQWGDVETTIIDDGKMDLGIMISAPIEKFDKLREEFSSHNLFWSYLLEDRK